MQAGFKVGIYERESKPPRGWKPSFPGEEPPGSIGSQREALKSWAARERHEVVIDKHDVATGSDPNRPNWEELMAEARGHHIQAIAVTKLDRAMRSVPHFYSVADELMRLGVDLIFTDTGMRLSRRDALSKATLGILAVVAELELDLARDRTRAVMHRGDDGKLYGPRSEKPAGRPPEYQEGDGHKFRSRGGARIHDKPRCPICREAKRRGKSA